MQDWNPEQLKEKLDANEAVFLKLWKLGCGACKLSEPAIKRLEESRQYPYHFAAIKIDDYPEMIEIAGTDVLPVFFVFKDGKKLGTHVGFKGLKKLQGFIDEFENKPVSGS